MSQFLRQLPRTINASRTFTTSAAKMGVTKTTTSEGTGPSPIKGQTVSMHYTGWLKQDYNKADKSNLAFDSSVKRGTPFRTQIGVGSLIKGWDEGVPQMKVGEKAILDITSDYGYGPRGMGPIPGGADLIFEVELLAIQ